MEWIILVVLVPTVIVPVVLLFGFAGCAAIVGIEDIKFVPGPPPPPPPPTPPPPIWRPEPAYTVDLVTDPAVVAQSLAGTCVVQVLPPAVWGFPGKSKIRITVRASPGAALTITAASVSKQADQSIGGNATWDSDSTPTILKTAGGSTSLTVPAGATGQLEGPYVPPDGVYWLVAFSISSGAGPRLTSTSQANGYDAVIKAGAPATDVTIAQRNWLFTPGLLTPWPNSRLLIEGVAVFA